MHSSEDDVREIIPFTQHDQLREARSVIQHEASALRLLADNLDESFCNAIDLITKSPGCVIVTGVGKAGLIGQKIVATMASTGTRAYFLHPTEAVHGDLGCVGQDDVVLALSNSGTTDEVLRLLPVLQRLNIPVIAVTRDVENALAKAATVVIPIGRHEEAGELRLAPSVSTTVMLAVGDALSLVLSRGRGFTEEDFATFHPAGSLGRQLKPVNEIMRQGDALRIASEDDTVRKVMIELSRPGRRTGAVVLTKASGVLTGIFTDSDLARLFEKKCDHQVDRPIREVMTVNPTTISPDALLPEAVHLMSDHKISELPVIDAEGRPVGLVDITDVIEGAALKDHTTSTLVSSQSSSPTAKSA